MLNGLDLSQGKLNELWNAEQGALTSDFGDMRVKLFGKRQNPSFLSPTQVRFTPVGHASYFEDQERPLRHLEQMLEHWSLTNPQVYNILNTRIQPSDVGCFYDEAGTQFFRGFTKQQHGMPQMGEQFFARVSAESQNIFHASWTTGPKIPGVNDMIRITRRDEEYTVIVSDITPTTRKNQCYMVFLMF